MPEPNTDYIHELMRKKTSGKKLSRGEKAYLRRYEDWLDANDYEPHQVSRSRTLEILSSAQTQRVLASRQP